MKLDVKRLMSMAVLSAFCGTAVFGESGKPVRAGGRFAHGLTVTCAHYEPQTRFGGVACWVPEDLKRPAAVYVFLEMNVDRAAACLAPLMKDGTVPPGIVVTLGAGICADAAGKASRGMRAVEFDSVGPSFPSALADEIVPFCAKTLGVTVDPSPDRHFITGASSGGIAAFNACWYRRVRCARISGLT